MNSPSGEKIGIYTLEKTLGEGGMGEVFLAFDPICQRHIAIKRIRKELLKYPSTVTRFLKEAQIASGLAHPSIIPVYSIHQTDKQLYYIMPYVEGETLKQILNNTRRRLKRGSTPHPVGSSIPALIRVFLSVAQAVSYSHSKNILHRDLKPENIMVGKFGEVQILDWGLAEYIHERSNDEEIDVKEREGLTRPGKVVGTLSHMTPERAMGLPADKGTDIYALGVILYHLLTLKLPFSRKSLKLFKEHMEKEEYLDPAEAAPDRDIPLQLSHIVEKCLAFRANERYDSVNDLIADLENYIEGRPDWIFSTALDLKRSEDFEFQETVMLTKNMAVTSNMSEWVVYTMAKGSYSGNIKIEANLKLAENCHGVGFLFCLPEAGERKGLEDGFILWIGSKNFPGTRLIRSNVEVINLPDNVVENAQLVIEKIDTNVSLYLDGRLIFNYIGQIPMVGSQLGLIYKDTDFLLQDWRIFTGSQNAMVGCLSIPDAFLASKDFDKALFEYGKIAQSFRGRVEGREAIFRKGITLLEMAKLRGNQGDLLEEAYAEFEKLQKTSGAPLEYLGKSLIYKIEGELDEEVNCLELSLRRYPKHPLIHRLEEHIIFRFHELANKHRRGTYLFALLVLRQLGRAFSNRDTHALLDTLKANLQPVYFIETPQHFEKEAEEFAHIAIQLAFWLNKPRILHEMLSYPLPDLLKTNILYALLELDTRDLAESGLKQHPCKDIEAILKGIAPESTIGKLYLAQHNLENASTILKGLTHSPEIDSVRAYAHLIQGERSEAESIFERYSVDEIRDPNSPLLPSFTSVHGASGFIETYFPKIPTLLSHVLSGTIYPDREWVKGAFYWEKKQLKRQIKLRPAETAAFEEI